MGRIRIEVAWVLAILSAATSMEARAYIPTVTSGGSPVTWRGELKLNLAGNSKNQSGIASPDLQAAVVRSLQRWQVASGGQMSFDYWQGTDPNIYLPNSDYNGLSSLYFASNAAVDPHLSPNVLGLTQVWYDTASGQILEADIVLNDKNFHFTTDPQDTSGFGSGGPTGLADGHNKVYVENVLTHELGHAFGLSHSGGLQSTMLFMESPEQAHLGCDEQTAIHALYPGADRANRGGISGKIVSGSGQPVFGAHILAISRRRGTVIATGLTGASGRYQISALEPGTYFLMVEPYYAGAAALPGYYAGVKDTVCSGADFSRSFLVDGFSARPIPIAVAPGLSAGAPDWVVRCNGDQGAVVRSAEGVARLPSAPEIFEGGGNGFGVTERFGQMAARYYKLTAVSGNVEIHAISYGLYSPVRIRLSLLDSSGQSVAKAQVSDPIYTGDSGYINYDSSLQVEGLEAGDYTVVASPEPVEAVHYPAGTLALDSTAFMLLTGSVNEGPPALAQEMTLNARCRMNENFPAYSSPPGNPPRGSVSNGGGGGAGFCGRVAESNRNANDRQGPTPGALAGWLLPWVLMLGFARLAKVRSTAMHRVTTSRLS